MRTFKGTLLAAVLTACALYTPRAIASPPGLRAMRLLDANTGWALAGDRLFLTSNAGLQWDEITPPASGERMLYGAFFLNGSSGWVLRTGSRASKTELARTSDGGLHWTIGSFPLSAENGARLSGSASIDFLDSAHGWAMLRLTSSSNFSFGILFATSDGGATWAKLPDPPIGDAVRFVTATDGWLAGGPSGDRLFVTRDGGGTWLQQTVGGGSKRYSLPVFEDGTRGTLAVTSRGPKGDSTAIYRTQDGGHSWQWSSTLPARFGAEAALAPFDSHIVRLWVRGDGSVGSEFDGRLQAAAKGSAVTPGSVLIGASFVDMKQGWAVSSFGSCTGEKTGCRQEQKLLSTGDAGASFHDITPTSTSYAIPDSTTTGSGQGFDQCAISSTGNMQTWFSDGPYRYSNVYIGGVNRACGQAGLNTNWVSQVVAQGWRLVPTWVGLQAPCSTCTSCSKFSSNPTTAASQGTSEANSANSAAGALGLTSTVIYYDMEAYNDTGSCPAAVQSFVNAWVSQLHALGDVAGVYGSASNALSDWAPIAHPPDDVWIALWNDQDTVENLTPIPNTDWDNNQRLHQYVGGHSETYGGVTFSIDTDVLDGAVTPSGGEPPPPGAWVGIAMAGSTTGYWTVKNDGGVFSYNGATFYGSMGGTPLNAPMVGMSAFPAGTGYWEVGADGGVFSFGKAKYHGSLPGSNIKPNKPVVGIESTLDGGGYWVVAADGGIFSYGDAVFYGSMGGKPLNAPIVGMARSLDGKGYWLVGADGGIFGFGDAGYYGSLPGLHVTPNKPITGMAPTADGKGYWLVGGDGGIFAFGDAPFYGSFVGKTAATIVGIAYDNAGGYIVVASDGTTYSAN